MSPTTQKQKHVRFLRYPGGKQRLLDFLMPLIPDRFEMATYFEPFLGGGAVFFALNPEVAILADRNGELINLYTALQKNPSKVWDHFESFPGTKEDYYLIRAEDEGSPELKAARTLYLNRTCFKGMWRYNALGKFNVGYGGQERRWSISEHSLAMVSKRLKHAELFNQDFESIIGRATLGDFIFLDPPYKPGAKEMSDAHYQFGCFAFEDHRRLARCLKLASQRGAKWAITTSSHPDILRLFNKDCKIIPVPRGTGARLGITDEQPGEVVILNY